jgi:hypothetical protein
VDRRGRLDDQPFSWTARADGSVIISYHLAPVAALRGQRAARFLVRVNESDTPGAQQLMARVTGTFRRGNERDGKNPA